MPDYAAFVSGISFRLLTADTPSPRLLRSLGARLPGAYAAFERLNTRLGEDGDDMGRRLRAVCRVPRMSTFAIGAMINRGVAQMPPGQAFVNVGVWNGFTFLAGLAGNADKPCIGVDNFSEFGGPRDAFLSRFERQRGPCHHFFDMDYREYFRAHHRGPIGFYIYDGEHSYANQLAGLEVAEPFLAPGCLILVDDTNAPEPRQATLDFAAARRPRFELVLDRTTCANHHPTFWNGVILLRKVS
jgi:hypothetical protein